MNPYQMPKYQKEEPVEYVPVYKIKEPVKVWGYFTALIALLFLPPVFAGFGIYCGIKNIRNGHDGHGVAQIIMSIVCGIWGAILGYIAFS